MFLRKSIVLLLIALGISCSNRNQPLTPGDNALIPWIKMSPLPTSNDILGIWGTSKNDFWVIGDHETIIHRESTSWKIIRETIFGIFYDVWSYSPQDIYSVGMGGTIYHFNGDDWSEVSCGNFLNLYGVWGSIPINVFSVGENGTIVRFSGTTWQPITSGTTNHLYGIWGTRASYARR